MKQSSIITSVFSEITVPKLTLKNVYTKLYNDSDNFTEGSNEKSSFSDFFEEIDWSSDEAKVEGNMEISYINGDAICTIYMPITSSFIFTCTRGKDENYKVNWSTCLS